MSMCRSNNGRTFKVARVMFRGLALQQTSYEQMVFYTAILPKTVGQISGYLIILCELNPRTRQLQ
jgi:hypothetical protein